MPEEMLRKLGLSEGEIKIYEILLDLGKSPVNKIHERTGIERRNIYDILNKLTERGLVAYIMENKKRFFHLAHPRNILGYIEEKKGQLDDIESDIKKQIPELVKKYEFTKPAINAEIFRGPSGMKAAWEDFLSAKENYWIGSARYIPNAFPIWWQNYNNRRIKKKVYWWNIFRHEMKGKIKCLPHESVKFLPKEWSGNPTIIGIYGNKVINFLAGKEMFAFVIESKELAEDYKLFHKYLWDKVCTL